MPGVPSMSPCEYLFNPKEAAPDQARIPANLFFQKLKMRFFCYGRFGEQEYVPAKYL